MRTPPAGDRQPRQYRGNPARSGTGTSRPPSHLRALQLLPPAPRFQVYREIPMIVLRAIRLAVFMLTFAALPARADYATPGTGVDWTMDQLVANAGGSGQHHPEVVDC